jgi:8-oxo-dGTP pyrophosphatase MutT (NUDIX family)
MSARSQAAVIAFRRRKKGVEVCLLRNRGSSKWKIPKGFVDPGETPPQSALKEASEEAGLKGGIVGESIGSYEYEKWGLDLNVSVYLMDVSDERDDWEESGLRERHWVSLEEALDLLKKHPVHPLLDAAKNKIERRSRPR